MMNEEVWQYLRCHPNWYIKLSRSPQTIDQLLKEIKENNRQRLIDKIDQIAMLINMIEMMM